MSENENKIINKIPIKNIYYLLSYAYTYLKIDEDVLKESEDFRHAEDLFARILINSLSSLIKSGFYRNYIVQNDDTSIIRGKINISESIKRQTLVNKRLNCSYDKFDKNVRFNQIIKSTIQYLIGLPNLDKKLIGDLKKFRPYFQDISLIKLTKETFRSLKWNKNNKFYRLPIHICQLIYENKLPEDNKKGKIRFKSFRQDKQNEYAKLYEKFVLNFYKKEIDKKGFKAHATKINWKLDESFNNDTKHLPGMNTDITLEYEDKQLIIDTKFYKNIFSSYHNSKIYHSNNLYQIFTYIQNSDFNGEINGVLLYASLDEDIESEFKLQDGKRICIKTLNLNQDWKYIDRDLREIANKYLFNKED
ncbi:MAG: 5-methylcytosine-specific restriction endonuclease system specificity protein McrC [Methanobrevibacter sp.]